MRSANSSMQLTRAADYGVRVMIHLVGQTVQQRVSLGALAGATGAPESFLSKVLQTLTRAGLLVSQRGQMGGFEVSPRGREASIRDVVEAVDGPIHLNLCLAPEKPCARKAWCPAHPVWARAQEAMLGVLDGARIDDLAHSGWPPAGGAQSSSAVLKNIAAAGAEASQGCACGAVVRGD